MTVSFSRAAKRGKRRAGIAGRRKKEKKRIYRAAVIGCGRIGSLLERDRLRPHPCTHAGYYGFHERTKIVAGCDLRQDRLEEFGRRWKVPPSRLFKKYQDLLSVVKPEIVSVATYTESHCEIVVAAARAGAKIILCEKPMARSLREADQMIRTCRRSGTLLVIHHERRWHPNYRAVRKAIQSGLLGEIRTVVGNVLTSEPRRDWHANPAVSGGGPTLHDGTHLFDAIRYLCGEIVSLRGETERKDPKARVEDTGRAWMVLENGARAFVECGGRREYFNFEIDIQGTRGRIVIGNAVYRAWTLGPSPRYEGFVEFSETAPPPPLLPDTFPFIVEEILEAYEEGRASISSGEDGREALRCVLGVYGRARIGSGFAE